MEKLLSKCCDTSTTWIDCPDCLAVGYTECFALRCDDCRSLDTDHAGAQGAQFDR